MHALITGGAGFIGSHLAEALLRRGQAVSVIDDLSTGSMENIKHLEQYADFSYTIDTVLNIPIVAELVEQADVIYHLAAAVGVRLIVESPVRTINTNIKATEVILDLACAKKQRVLITSTSEVYGKLARIPFSEEDDLVLGPTSRARWAYAASKIIDEFLAKAYHDERGLPATVVRLFNTIGPRQTGNYGMVVPRFIQQALRGEPITVFGDGKQRRSFTWIGDAVDAIMSLLDHSGVEGEVFNIGHSKDISIRELAELVKRLTKSDSPIQNIPYTEAYGEGFEDMRQRLPDISKIHQLIGYTPSLNLPGMLERIIQYERENMAPLGC